MPLSFSGYRKRLFSESWAGRSPQCLGSSRIIRVGLQHSPDVPAAGIGAYPERLAVGADGVEFAGRVELGRPNRLLLLQARHGHEARTARIAQGRDAAAHLWKETIHIASGPETK